MNNKTYTTLNGMGTNRPNDDYGHLLNGIRQSFQEAVRDGNEPLFTTDCGDLYEVFLNNIPAEFRQEYNCNTCRHFVNTYGGLVRIDDEGNIEPVMWSHVPSFFAPAINWIRHIVKHSKVTGIFVTDCRHLGTAKTGIWTHMAVEAPTRMVYKGRINTASQVTAEKLEDFKMLMTAYRKYKLDTVKTAVNLLRSDTMYRSEKVGGIAEWFLEVINTADIRVRYISYYENK